MSAPSAATPAAPRPGPPLDVPFDELPRESILRAFGVEYVHVRPPEGGDLYLTRFGWPHVRQLLPQHWYTDQQYAERGVKLPGGSGHVYRVHTRPEGGRPCDLVVKFSRMAQEVSIVVEGTMPDLPADNDVVAQARYNSPMEEFGLVMEMRRGERGPRDLRLLAQRPLAIYAPPEAFDLWQLGRSDTRFYTHHHMLAQDQSGAQWAIELDIRRVYVLLYSWIKGLDAEDCHHAGLLGDREFAAITPRVTGDMAAKGFRVIDNKPKHYILRPRADGRGLLRDRTGELAYGLVDFEFLQRTQERERAHASAQRGRFWSLRTRRPGDVAPSADARTVRVFETDWLFSPLSDGGKLWVRGADPGLFDYFMPDRWRRTPRVKLSETSQTFRTRTRDGLHVIYRLSRCGLRPHADPLTDRGRRIREHGYNSAFEEAAIAELLPPLGIPTVVPQAIYRTAHETTQAPHLRDPRRFASHAHLLTPEDPPEPMLSPRHDYYTIWVAFRGQLPPRGPSADADRGIIDLERAVEDQLLSAEESAAALESARRRLVRRGLPAQGLAAEDLVVRLDPHGGVARTPGGEVAMLLGIDLLTAYEFGLLGEEAYRELLLRSDERLRAADHEKLDPTGRHLLLTMDPDGRFERDAAGWVRTVLASFALVRGLYRPVR